MIVGISGKISSGKDTVGRIIQWLTSEHLRTIWLNNFDAFLEEAHKFDDNDSKFEIRKFADKLKDIVCMLIDCTREQLEDQEFKNTELSEEWWYYQLGNNFNGNLSELYSYLEWKDIVTPSIKYSNLPIRKLTPRLLLQLLGTDCGRNIIHPNIWVNSLMSEYKCLVTKRIDIMDFSKNPQETIRGKEFQVEDNLLGQYPNWIITDMRFPNELEAIKSRKGITIRVNRPIGGSKFEGTQEEWDKLVERNKQSQHESETALDNAEFDYTIDNNGTIEELIEKVKEVLIKEKIIQDETI